MTAAEAVLDRLLGLPVFATPPADKERALLERLAHLHDRHRLHCRAYAALSSQVDGFAAIADVPFLSVDLFKHLDLRSVVDDEVSVVLQSSGTGPRGRSRVALDRGTGRVQSRMLIRILAQLLGPARLPMLVFDRPPQPGDGALPGRSVAALGFMQAGRRFAFALDERGALNRPEVQAFAEQYGAQPCFVFGLTATLWEHLVSSDIRLDLPGAVVLHGGGWKRLERQRVDREKFADLVRRATGSRVVRNYYGLVEQVGTVFVEDAHGALCAPVFADVIIRDPATLAPCPPGVSGLVQVLSAAPESYPGHSLLTGDLGRIVPAAPGDPWIGSRLEVLGRAPEADLRGCGNVG